MNKNYVSVKAIRLPIDKYGYTREELLKAHSSKINADYTYDSLTWNIGCTDNMIYLDYILEKNDKYQIQVVSKQLDKKRTLTNSEKSKYKKLFMEFIPSLQTDDLELVEYRWYDASDAAWEDNSFYEEV